MRETRNAREHAQELLDERFGLGAELTHQKLRTDVVAKAIYDCSMGVVTSLVEALEEIRTLSDREMADGDGARRVASAALKMP